MSEPAGYFALLSPGFNGEERGRYGRCPVGRNYDRICLSYGDAPGQGARYVSGVLMASHFVRADVPMSMPRDDRPRPLQVAQCSLCGIALPIGLMVPDGGQACADVRWYCKDAQACTERWTAHPPRPGPVAPARRELPAAGGERTEEPVPSPDPVPAELMGSAAHDGWSVDLP